jgi:uncharacterized membrane protein YoaK (UPF0700 family)
MGLVGLPMMLLGGSGVLLLAMGFILFVLGVIFSVMLYRKAQQSEAK